MVSAGDRHKQSETRWRLPRQEPVRDPPRGRGHERRAAYEATGIHTTLALDRVLSKVATGPSELRARVSGSLAPASPASLAETLRRYDLVQAHTCARPGVSLVLVHHLRHGSYPRGA